MPITAGYVWRPYVKPSLKGALIFRVRTVRRKSEWVRMINQQLEAVAGTGRAPAARALELCRQAGKTYRGKDGKEHCPLRYFITFLRRAMKEVVHKVKGTGYTPPPPPVPPAGGGHAI